MVILDFLKLRLQLALVTRERDELKARVARLERDQQQGPMRPHIVPIGWDGGSDVEYRMYEP
jgi:hypothetical protein